MIPACPSRMCFFNRGNIEGTNSLKICVWCLCMYVLGLQSDWFHRLTWQTVDIYIYTCEKSLEMHIAYDLSLTVLRWPCAVDRTLKFSYYYYYLCRCMQIISLPFLGVFFSSFQYTACTPAAYIPCGWWFIPLWYRLALKVINSPGRPPTPHQ